MQNLQIVISSFSHLDIRSLCVRSFRPTKAFDHTIAKKQGWLIVHRASFIVLLAFLAACARQGVPAGGPKDTKPPLVDSLASTPNFATRFDKKRIELKFNEWVVLSDAATQVVISPPLAKRPEVLLKGKTVVVDFDKNEVLRPNTTYTVNFGSAVKDLHEGNVAKDLRFVFSTGDFIDSLSIRGIVSDAFTGEPVENISVMLYENFADSALRKERPYYFSKTDKSGLYELRNLKSGAFRVAAIDDADQNLKWDGDAERIAFRDSGLVISPLPMGPVNLKLFKNRPRFRLVGQNAGRYGLLKLGFSIPIDSFEIQTLAPEGMKTLVEKNRDSLMLWYDLPLADSTWSLIFTSAAPKDPESKNEGPFLDTIPVKKLSRSEFLSSHRIAFGDVALPPSAAFNRGKPSTAPPKPQPVKTIVQTVSRSAMLPFNFPIAGFDTSKWVLTVDSNRLTNFKVKPDSSSPRRLFLDVDWKQGKTYTLSFLPGALSNFWGTENADTLGRVFNVLPDKQLGTLTLSLEKLRPGAHYILQILNGTQLEEERQFMAEGQDQKLVFDHLQVAAYTARLVEDSNGSGRWDSGDFRTKQQPELVFNKKLDALRANWELEVKFSTEESVNAKKPKQ